MRWPSTPFFWPRVHGVPLCCMTLGILTVRWCSLLGQNWCSTQDLTSPEEHASSTPWAMDCYRFQWLRWSWLPCMGAQDVCPAKSRWRTLTLASRFLWQLTGSFGSSPKMKTMWNLTVGAVVSWATMGHDFRYLGKAWSQNRFLISLVALGKSVKLTESQISHLWNGKTDPRHR